MKNVQKSSFKGFYHLSTTSVTLKAVHEIENAVSKAKFVKKNLKKTLFIILFLLFCDIHLI